MGFSAKQLETLKVLTEGFKLAKAAAQAADPGDGLENDGGTCNFDSPAFNIPRINTTVLEQAAADSGCRVNDFTWFGKRYYWLGVDTKGQANRRTRMAEAAYRVLKDYLSATMPQAHVAFYQQMD